MDRNRRRFLQWAGLGAGAAVALPARAAPRVDAAAGFDVAQLAPRPGSSDDHTATLQRAIDQAAASRTPLTLAPGIYRAAGLVLPAGMRIVGTPGATRLVANRARPVLAAPHAADIQLSGLSFDGGGQPLPDGQGLVTLADGERVRVSDCEFIGAGGFGLRLDGIGGEITGCTVLGAADVAIFSYDARGLVIARNTVRRAGNNGIQVWRREAGYDGTSVLDNAIFEIGARDGGSGQNGNGVNVFRASDVTVRGNRITDCMYSAVRGNAASNMRVIENACRDLGEVALYAEFGFQGAVIANNTVDGAGHGISVTNFNDGGRLAVIQGNILRNLAPQPRAGIDNATHGVGIYAEADTAVTGNVIERAARAGIVAGWGRYLRDVSVTGNVVRQADIGIGVSVVTGAGAALIANNLISGAARGAILGMDHDSPVTDDLARGGAARYSQITLSGNRVS